MKPIRRKKLYLLIDTSHIIYVVYYSLAESDRTTKNIIEGFLQRIADLCLLYKTTKLIFFWDSPVSRRKMKYPFYKEKRKEKHKQDDHYVYLKEARKELNLILPSVGFFARIEIEGYEADDTMCAVVSKYKDNNFIIVARDNDLFQILRYPNLLHIYCCATNKRITSDDVLYKYGIHPRDWHIYKCFGCKSDEVPGIPTIGDVTARKFINGTLPKDSKAMKLIFEHRNTTLMRNWWLVTLPLRRQGGYGQLILKHNAVTPKRLKQASYAFSLSIIDDPKWHKVCEIHTGRKWSKKQTKHHIR